MAYYQQWRPYVPVHQRLASGAREIAKLAKQQKFTPQPVAPIAGREIASTFWGRAWCDNLERYSDFENRLPRGRTYVRNGSVVHLAMKTGEVQARVAGSELYTVRVTVAALPAKRWQALARECQGHVGSLVELLEGRLSKSVMALLVRPQEGLFPTPHELRLSCSCPDSASMCKHVAATLYGVGARLDAQPELLFTLRAVDHGELIAQAGAVATLGRDRLAGEKRLADGDLADLFGIEIEATATPAAPVAARRLRSTSRKLAPTAPAAAKRLRAAPLPTSSPRPLASAAPVPASSPRPLASAAPVPTVSSQQLEQAGIGRRLWKAWLALGALRPTDRPGIYERTPALDDLLADLLRRTVAG